MRPFHDERYFQIPPGLMPSILEETDIKINEGEACLKRESNVKDKRRRLAEEP